jgi:tetratricopeptide (TPR) repeat protein
MALQSDDKEGAKKRFEAGFGIGGEDYRARMALGKMAMNEDKWEEAEQNFRAAEKAFPGYAESGFSAEVHLAAGVRAPRARRRPVRRARTLAGLELGRLRHLASRSRAGTPRTIATPRQARYFERANEIDPFRNALHVDWGKSLSRLARHEEALREFRVALMVPPELERAPPHSPPGARPGLSDAAKAEILGLQALELLELGRNEEAEEAARKALQLQGDEAGARRALERLGKS